MELRYYFAGLFVLYYIALEEGAHDDENNHRPHRIPHPLGTDPHQRGVVLAHNEFRAMHLVRLDNYIDARCLDGSSGAYYYAKGTGVLHGRWRVVHREIGLPATCQNVA